MSVCAYWHMHAHALYNIWTYNCMFECLNINQAYFVTQPYMHTIATMWEISVHIYIYIHTHIMFMFKPYIYILVCVCAYVFKCIYTYMYVCIFIPIYLYTYLYVYIYISIWYLPWLVKWLLNGGSSWGFLFKFGKLRVVDMSYSCRGMRPHQTLQE